MCTTAVFTGFIIAGAIAMILGVAIGAAIISMVAADERRGG